MAKSETLNTNTNSIANLQVVANSGCNYRNKLLLREMFYLLVDVCGSGAQTARRRLTRAEVDVVSGHLPPGYLCPVLGFSVCVPPPTNSTKQVAMLTSRLRGFKVRISYTRTAFAFVVAILPKTGLLNSPTKPCTC